MNGDRDDLLEAALRGLDTLMSLRRRAMCHHPTYRGVSTPQVHILFLLMERGQMTVSELAALLNISAPSGSSIIDRMVEHRLVTRERDSRDRRVVHVAVSDHGRTVVEEVMGLQRDKVQRLFASLSDDDLVHVVRGLDAIVRAVSASASEAERLEGIG